jgi:hypothetical protein
MVEETVEETTIKRRERRRATPARGSDAAPTAAGRGGPELESLGRSRADDAAGGGPSKGVGFAEFLGEISGAMVAAQQRLDGQTESYLAGSSSPLPLPTMFRIPRLAAEMKFALSTESAEGFKLFFQTEESETTRQEQSLTFEIVAVPPPPESGITPAPYVPLMPRIALLFAGPRREWLSRIARDTTAASTLGVPAADDSARSRDEPLDLLAWHVIRPDEPSKTEHLYLVGAGGTGAARMWLARVPKDGADESVALHQLTVQVNPPLPAPIAGWLTEFMQAAGQRQAAMLKPADTPARRG